MDVEKVPVTIEQTDSKKRSSAWIAGVSALAAVVAGIVSYSVSVTASASASLEILPAAPPISIPDCHWNAPDVSRYLGEEEALPRLLSMSAQNTVTGLSQNPCLPEPDNACASIALENDLVGSIDGDFVLLSTGGTDFTIPEGCSADLSRISVFAYACSEPSSNTGVCGYYMNGYIYDGVTPLWDFLDTPRTVSSIEAFQVRQSPYISLEVRVPVRYVDSHGTQVDGVATLYSVARFAGTSTPFMAYGYCPVSTSNGISGC